MYVIESLCVPQRRETSHRKAKIRNNASNMLQNSDANQMDDLDEPSEFIDSDSDWTPQKVVVLRKEKKNKIFI